MWYGYCSGRAIFDQTIAMTFSNLKKLLNRCFLITLFVFIAIFQSCKKKPSKLANDLYRITQNKIFINADPVAYTAIFKQELVNMKLKLNNRVFIQKFYKNNDYEPVFAVDHLNNGDLDILQYYYCKTYEHGLDPKLFEVDELIPLIEKFHSKAGFKTIDEAYHTLAQLELLTASSLLKYSNALQFGIINPKLIYRRYFTATKRPDSISMMAVFTTKSIRSFLDSIQPKNPQYTALQKALASGQPQQGLSKEETQRYLKVNLERLRWRNKPYEPKYVYVNIPDYELEVFEDGKPVLNMKVCVGQGRNMDGKETLMIFGDTSRYDKPFPRETPQLSSLIHSVNVNPVWNIPQSIANKEIVVEAAQDRYYLANKNIDVFKNGIKIEDPENIDWSLVTKENNDYEFKQRPGDDNSLGKIKFLFKNRSSVYLHDTPAKSPFSRAMRAVSHGCVRLGNPQALAQNLFGEGEDYDKIIKDMSEDNPEPTNIALPKKTPIYITYVTCWADKNGLLQYRPDVYGLDIVLYASLEKLTSR